MRFLFSLFGIFIFVFLCVLVLRTQSQTGVSVTAFVPPRCNDLIDNDGDALIDYPLDPGCSSLSDDNESDVPLCSDLIDNDGDALIDYPLDPGCSSLSDDDEFNLPLPSVSGGSITPSVQQPIFSGAPTSVFLDSFNDLYKPVITFRVLRTVDLNKDGNVNIIDLSILLYYYQQPMHIAREYDLNSDGFIDIVDISIMLYYWT